MRNFTNQKFFQPNSLKLLICIGIFFSSMTSAFAIGVCTVNRLNTASQIPVGSFPRQVVAGDLNDDGAPDMVVVNGSSSSSSAQSATVLLNDRRGGFITFNTINYNLSISGVALNDFNQDGTLDLAVTGTNSSGSGATSALTVYFNNGNAVFTSQRTTSFANSVVALATGDFNQDGAVDVAAATSPSSSNFGAVTILLNNGFGVFTTGGNFSIGGVPRAVGVSDFNRDGIQDVVTVNTNGTGSLLLGAGGSNFQLASNFTVSPNSSSFFSAALAVGDLNNDSRDDLAIVSGDSNSFFVLLNNGAGFAAAVQTTFTNIDFRPRAVVIAQTVADASPDLNFAGNGNFSDSISAAVVVPGNGNGTFSAANAILAPTGITPVSLAVADFSGDGRNDLATANANSSDVSVLSNNGADRFGPNVFPTIANPTMIVAADFNGDGSLDTATATSQVTTNFGNTSVALGNGAGGVSLAQTLVGGTASVQALAAGDVNGDARVDLIVANAGSFPNSTIAIYLNSGNGTTLFSNVPQASFSINFNVRTLALGDFNNDGRRDLIATSSSNNLVAVFLGAATGVFSASTTFAAPVSNALATTGDFNGDGRLDLLLAGAGSNGAGAVFTLLGGGNGGFTQAAESVAVNSPTSVASGDFNGDGILDFATTGFSSFSGSNNSAVSVALGIGNGRFGAPAAYLVGADARSVTAADFNGDSRLDLITVNRTGNSVSILTNLGGGNFGQTDNFLAGIFPEQLVVGDFNRDGRADVATVNRGGNNVSIINNSCREAVSKTDYNGDGRSDYAIFRPTDLNWYALSSNLRDVRNQPFGNATDIQTPGDYDGDGITDFAVFRPANGVWYILRSSTNRSFSVAFGAGTDVPVANDYDGDGRTDIAVFRPSNGTWYIRQSANLQNQFVSYQFGQSGDRPVAADYDGDGRADIAVYRGGNWIVLRSANSSVSYQSFGIASDVLVPADYDGDGRVDLGVFRDGVWYILGSASNALRVENFGTPTDRTQPADYDGDGRTDVAVWRENEGIWYVLRSSDRQVSSVRWGMSGDVPVNSIYRY